MVKAQNRWSLQKCVTYATENSLAIKQSIAQIRNAELTLKQNQLSRLPNLNAGVSGGYQFGRTIDPTTNSFALEGIGFNSYSLNTGIQVFGGGIIKHNILRSKYELEAGKLEAEATENNLGLQVAAAYLNVLLADEQLVIAKTRLLQSENQLNQINRFIEVGARPINERYDFEAALALDQQALIEAENFLIRSNLILRQFLLIPDGTPFDIEKPEIKIPEDADVDGMHIRLLMMTFFLQFFPDLVRNGHLYILETPLFRVRNKKETIYCYSDEERLNAIQKLGPKPEITRFKGLGEISPEEFGKFIGDNIRLEPVILEKDTTIPKILTYFMGKNTPDRQRFIIDNLIIEKDPAEAAA